MKRKASMNVIRILFLCIMMVVLMLFWTLSFFLTNYMYSMLGISPQEWMQQMITSVTGLLLLFLTMFIVTRFNKRIGNKHEEFFQSITDGIQQIATGNFDINIAKSKEHNHPNDPFSRIVDDINHMAKQLGEVEEMRQQFISNVSHEIQSPLTSISGFARALKNEELTRKEREHYLTIIESESQRLSNISDNLLKLTYLENENHDFVLKKYRLDQQLQRIVLASEVQWQEKHIDMELHMEETWLTADEELLNQVWMNLVSNAIKFTEDHGKVSMEVVEGEAEITVNITDTGIGISEEEKLHVFERFYKADKARTRHKSGSGLGLSIVKKILHLHDATIQVESDEAGTTFSITFAQSPAN